jgi:hypothetical protein
MKKLLLFILLLPVFAWAQNTTVQKVQTIIQLKAFPGSAAYVWVADSALLYSTCSPCTADEVYIFAGTRGRKWQRILKTAISSGTAFDTTGKFTDYQAAINARIKYTDSAAMLAAYQTALLARLRYADTTTLLSAYATALNARIKYTDTATVLAAYATALNARIKYTDSAAMLSAYASALNARIRYADSAAMLSAYASALNARVRYADTATMLDAYEAALNSKFNTADTTALLAAYQTALNLRLSIASAAATYATIAHNQAIATITGVVDSLRKVFPQRIFYNNTDLSETAGANIEQEVWRDTIPAGTLGPNSKLIINLLISGTGTGDKHTFIKLNGTQVSQLTITSTNIAAHFGWHITNRNSLTSQITGGVNQGTPAIGFGSGTGAVQTRTIDFSADVIITITQRVVVLTDVLTILGMDAMLYY